MRLSEKSVRLSNWPYYHGKVAKLVAIGKPYWRGTQYWVKVKFKPEMGIDYSLPLTDLTMLIRDAEYIDGRYQQIESTSIETLNLEFSGGWVPKPHLSKKRRNKADEFESYTFGFKYQRDYYVLPLEVILRDVLAPDAEMLHLLTTLDIRDKKFLTWKDNSVLRIEVMSDVPYKYSKNQEKMMHIAWVYTNPKIEKTFSQIFENIRNGKGILFDWCFNKLKCSVMYKVGHNNIRFVKSITQITKKINVDEVHVDDIRDSKITGDPREKKERNRIVAQDAEELISCGKGKNGDLSHWAPNPVTISYDVHPKYVRSDQLSRASRTTSSYKDKTVVIGDGRRTTGDYTGDKSIPKLIFKQHSCVQNDSSFPDISNALQLLKGEESIIEVESYSAKLSLHADTGLFRFLDDRISERYYFAGKIKFKDGKEAIMIDLQREKRNISMLMLIAKCPSEWEGIIHEIIKNMIEKSGKWPTHTLWSLRNSYFLYTDRCNHTNVSYDQLAQKILRKCSKKAH